MDDPAMAEKVPDDVALMVDEKENEWVSGICRLDAAAGKPIVDGIRSNGGSCPLRVGVDVPVPGGDGDDVPEPDTDNGRLMPPLAAAAAAPPLPVDGAVPTRIGESTGESVVAVPLAIAAACAAASVVVAGMVGNGCLLLPSGENV